MNEVDYLIKNQEQLTEYLVTLSNDYLRLIREQRELEDKVKYLEKELITLNEMFLNHTHKR